MIRTCARRYSLLRLRACVRPGRVQWIEFVSCAAPGGRASDAVLVSSVSSFGQFEITLNARSSPRPRVAPAWRRRPKRRAAARDFAAARSHGYAPTERQYISRAAGHTRHRILLGPAVARGSLATGTWAPRWSIERRSIGRFSLVSRVCFCRNLCKW